MAAQTAALAAKTSTSTAPKKGSNYDKAREAAFKTADELGKQAGKGDLAVSQAFTNVVKFADDGLFSETDASEYATRIANSRSAAGFGEAGERTIKKNASLFTQGIKAATLPAVDFTKVCQRVYTTFTGMRATGQAAKPLIEAYTSAARVQLAQPTKELTAAQIGECCAPFVKENKERSRVQFWLGIQKAIEKAYEKGLDRTDEAVDALDAVRERISHLPDEEVEAHENARPGKKRKVKKTKPLPNGNAESQTSKPSDDVTSTVALEVGVQHVAHRKSDPTEPSNKPKSTVGVASPLGPPTPLMSRTIEQIADEFGGLPVDDDTNVTALMTSAQLLKALRQLGAKV